jgi:hypothetical protein
MTRDESKHVAMWKNFKQICIYISSCDWLKLSFCCFDIIARNVMEHTRIKVNAIQAITIYKYKNLKTKLTELYGLIIKLFGLKMTRNESKHVTMWKTLHQYICSCDWLKFSFCFDLSFCSVSRDLALLLTAYCWEVKLDYYASALLPNWMRMMLSVVFMERKSLAGQKLHLE